MAWSGADGDPTEEAPDGEVPDGDDGSGEAAAAEGDESQPGQKRKRMTPEEAVKKIKRTVGWYNHNGGLLDQIVYKEIRSSIEAIDPREALKILKELEGKAGEIRNPTAWVKKAAEKVGPELDVKVRKTIAWYNKHGGLNDELRYDELRGVLGQMPPAEALKLLQTLDEKGPTIQKPTSYLYRAAQKKLERDGYAAFGQTGTWNAPAAAAPGGGGPWARPARAPAAPAPNPFPMVPAKPAWGASSSGGDGVDAKVKKTIGWYNRNGGLQQEIRFEEVAPVLTQVGATSALQILKGLDGKGDEIRNPTAWIMKAAQKLVGGS